MRENIFKMGWKLNWLFAILIFVLVLNQWTETFSPLIGSIVLIALAIIFFRVLPQPTGRGASRRGSPWWLYAIGVLMIILSIIVLLHNLVDIVTIPYVPFLSDIIEGDITVALAGLLVIALLLVLVPSKMVAKEELSFAVGR